MLLSDIVKSGSFMLEKESLTLSYLNSSTSLKTVLQSDEISDFVRAMRFYEGTEGKENVNKFKNSLEVRL